MPGVIGRYDFQTYKKRHEPLWPIDSAVERVSEVQIVRFWRWRTVHEVVQGGPGFPERERDTERGDERDEDDLEELLCEKLGAHWQADDKSPHLPVIGEDGCDGRRPARRVVVLVDGPEEGNLVGGAMVGVEEAIDANLSTPVSASSLWPRGRAPSTARSGSGS